MSRPVEPDTVNPMLTGTLTDRGDPGCRPAYPTTGTVEYMASDNRTDTVDERGVTITAEGRRRARAELAAAADRDPQEREQARRDFLALIDAQR